MLDRWRHSRRATTLPKPVISIGNLTMGGTGKTPLLIHLANSLNKQGVNPAVLCRGYGQDEVALMNEKCPGVPLGVGADRVASAKELLATRPVGVFLLDDGFQHWSLRRDLDIVCIDATRRDELLLPAGNLREPWSALRRADAVVLTRTHLMPEETNKNLKERIRTFAPTTAVLATDFNKTLVDAGSGRAVPWESLQGKTVLALSAIGNPKAFEMDLEKAGAKVVRCRFRDHHTYGENDVVTIKAMAKINSASIVCTEKDWVKLRSYDIAPLVVRLDVRFSAEDQAVWNALIAKVLA